MTFRLVETGWTTELVDAMGKDRATLRLVCPFIKKGAVERLFSNGKPDSIQAITRFDLNDFARGVSDLAALRSLLDRGAQIRGVKHLHAKVYLFGGARVIVTSANLTLAALDRNHEFGFVAENDEIVQRCGEYFDALWRRAGANLTETRLAQWENAVTRYLASGACPTVSTGLADEGVDAGVMFDPIALPPFVGDARQAFVKFFGISSNRPNHSMPVLEEVQRTGCHWACTYPDGKRPRRVEDGALMFMGRLVKEPNDILIYGRAVGMSHQPGRDDATAADIEKRDWKANWPHYIRVHHAEFVAGDLARGVSLYELMDALKSDAFLATQRNAANGKGNTDPRRAYMQQAAVELTQQATIWLSERLQLAFDQHGKLAPAELAGLDWPEVPAMG